MRLVDLSRAQSGRIDWPRVRAAGYSGAIVQLTQGGSEQAERVAYGVGRIRELAAEGLPVWVYHYAHPRHTEADALDEGARFAAALAPVRDLVQLPVWLDYEEFGAGTPQTRAERALWCMFWAMESGIGSCSGDVGIYTGRSNADQFDTALVVRRWPLWVAWYPWGENAPPATEEALLARWAQRRSVAPWPVARVALWQYSSAARVPGIEGRCDVNLVLQPKLLGV